MIKKLLTSKIFDGQGEVKKSVLQQVQFINTDYHPKVFIKRDDLIHSEISGNKWRKLKYNLIEASEKGYKTLLTFGGAYSNHIYAVAAAGKIFGFKTIGIIRGEEHQPLNNTLSFAKKHKMEIRYLERSIYRNRNSESFQNEIASQFDKPYVIPEGGSNLLALKGVAELIGEIDISFDYICSAVGSGGTLAGIICGLNSIHKGKKVLGFPAIKGGEYLSSIIASFINNYQTINSNNWELIYDYHFGGFAKIDFELISFIEEFEKNNSIKLDSIYTGKMLFGIYDLIKKGYFNSNETIVAIHTGGLQGNAGMAQKIYKILSREEQEVFINNMN